MMEISKGDEKVQATEEYKQLPIWILTNRFFHKDLTNADNPMFQVAPNKANLVSSIAFEENGVEYHTPVLDIDMPISAIPSTTPGHYHLYIEKLLPKDKYEKLLLALNEAGIIQDGIIEKQWKQDGKTCNRLPGVFKKPTDAGSGVSAIPGSTVWADTSVAVKAKTPQPLKADTSMFTLSDEVIMETKKKPLTSQSEHAKMVDEFKSLAELSSKLGIELDELVNAWYKFKKASGNAHPKIQYTPSENVPMAQPFPDKEQW